MRIVKRALFLLIAASSFLPAEVLAHGTEEEHQRELLIGNTIAVGSGILFVLFLIAYFVVKNKVQKLNVKKQEQRDKRKQFEDISKILRWGWILTLLIAVGSGGWSLVSNDDETNTASSSSIVFDHVHGLGITSDGEELYIPAHDGLRVYKDGEWSIPEGEKHDYMGFSMVDDGFYSSGHPAPNSDMPNPFGVIKSTDGGKSIETLDLLGEVDFHGMAAGYRSHSIYVFNPEPNSKMDEAGLYYTTDEAKTWTKSEMNGLNSTPTALAVHPDDEAIIVLGAEDGIYVSEDYGQTFKKEMGDFQVTSLSFDSNGKLLVGAVQQGKPVFYRYSSESSTTSSSESWDISIPPMEEDAVQYIAANPQNSDEFVIVTFKKDVYKTSDAGENWVQLVSEGKTINSSSKE